MKEMRRSISFKQYLYPKRHRYRSHRIDTYHIGESACARFSSRRRSKLWQERVIMLKDCKISGFADEIDGSLDRQIEVLKELGQTYIELRSADEINVSDLTIPQAQSVKEKLNKAGIRVSSLGSPIGKIGILDDFEPHMEKLAHTLELAQLFETSYIRMFSFYIPEGEGPERYTDEVCRRTEKMIAAAEKKGIILLHENEKGIYGDKAIRCQKLMEKFSSAYYKAVFDFANFVQCGQDTIEAYEMLKPYIAYVHVKDALGENGEVVLAGDGDGNVRKILGELERSGYDGFLSLEPHLTLFAGFEKLEKAGADKIRTDKVAAYKAAYGRLQEIIVA